VKEQSVVAIFALLTLKDSVLPGFPVGELASIKKRARAIELTQLSYLTEDKKGVTPFF